TTLAGAWRALLGDAKSVAVKFNQVGAPTIGTTERCATAIVESLAEADYAPDRVVLVETAERVRRELGCRGPVSGWGASIPVGENQEQVARWLLEADAVVNVPFLKTHQIAGMSGCLKNISHAVIRHPARYHANGCAPYVGQVISAKEVSEKLRVHVMDAVRIVVRNGPDARVEDVVGLGAVFAGVDPVAVDTVALESLGVERLRLGLPGLIDVPSLVAAGQMVVGRWRPAEIDRVQINLDT
ncbi:MAG: DUF362 domain-containing protein, partial [Phycisphaerae bacterium]|nr:DUF362 domain-containing protein [Phycisphaerae bacterium]